jgi:hypothetical protein
MSFFGGYADAMQFNEQQKLRERDQALRERADSRAERDSEQARRLKEYQINAADREQRTYQDLEAIPTERDAPTFAATPDFYRSTLGLADNDQGQAFANLDPETAARVMQAVRGHNLSAPDSGRAWRAETQPDGSTRLGLAGKIRRSDREIAGDRARILSRGGLGIQGINASEDYLTKVVGRHKQEMEEKLNAIYNNPNLSDKEKAVRMQNLLTDDQLTPGSYMLNEAGDGKYTLKYYDPVSGRHGENNEPRSLQQIMMATLKGINVDNYLRLKQDGRADNADTRANAAERRAEGLYDPQLRTANSNATVAERTIDSRVSQSQETARQLRQGNDFDARTADDRARLVKVNAQTGELKLELLDQTFGDLVEKAELDNRLVESMIELRKKLGDSYGAKASGSSARPGKLAVNVLQENGKYVKQELTVTYDKDGKPSYFTADGRPFTNKDVIDKALGTQGDKARLLEVATLDIAAARKKFEGGGTYEAYMRDQDDIYKRLTDQQQRLAFRNLDTDGRVEKLTELLADGKRPNVLVESLGATQAEVKAAQDKVRLKRMQGRQDTYTPSAAEQPRASYLPNVQMAPAQAIPR